jgi:hypothetical protein
MQAYLWIGALLGSSLGGLVPWLWGGSLFSYASIALSFAGGIAGLWLGFRLFYGGAK